MTQSNGNDRLARIEKIVEANSLAIEETNRAIQETRRSVEETTRSVEETRRSIEETRRSIEETKKIAESNSRTIQAMLEQRATERLEHEQRMRRLENLTESVARVQEGVTRMLVSIDDERPTILRKLNTIENKVDRLLDRNE